MSFYEPPGAYRKPTGYDVVKEPTVQTMKAIIESIPTDMSVVDIGAGKGVLVKELRDKGYMAFGLDGIPRIEKLTDGMVKWFDLTGDCSEFFGCADYGLFFEVGEHIPEKYEARVLFNVSRMPKLRLIVSWAHEGVGVGKKRHVNCRTQVYVASEFARHAWFVNDEETVKLRKSVHSRNVLRERIMVLGR